MQHFWCSLNVAKVERVAEPACKTESVVKQDITKTEILVQEKEGGLS